MLNFKGLQGAPIGMHLGTPNFFVCKWVYIKFGDFGVYNKYPLDSRNRYTLDAPPTIPPDAVVKRIVKDMQMAAHAYQERTGRICNAATVPPAIATNIFPYVYAQMTGVDPNSHTFDTPHWTVMHCDPPSRPRPKLQAHQQSLV